MPNPSASAIAAVPVRAGADPASAIVEAAVRSRGHVWLANRPAQRIGLSATVEPVDEVARYLAGGRPVDVVRPPSTKEWDLDVVVPIADMSSLGQVVEDDLSGPAAGVPA